MEVIFRPEAVVELLEARQWYEEQSPGLGSEFSRALDVAVAKVVRNPLAYACIEEDFRHLVLRRFPYSLIYVATAQQLLIVSCFHHRRKPGSWRNRVA